MKNFILIVFILLSLNLYCQEIDLHLSNNQKPNYGLAMTGTGMTLCVIGTSMSQSPQPTYSGRYGINYVRYESQNNRSLRLSTMAIGTVVTIVGILLQNRNKRKNNDRGRNT